MMNTEVIPNIAGSESTMSQHTPYTLDDGALIFVKTGHLLNKDNE